MFFLLICGAYQLFGKYYKGVEGEIIPGLEIFDYYTEAIEDRKKRCIGNIVIEADLNGKKTKVIGFENHGGQTFDIQTPFGNVLSGMVTNLKIPMKAFSKTMSLQLTYMDLFFLKIQNFPTIL